jgi:hypothetical protein
VATPAPAKKEAPKKVGGGTTAKSVEVAKTSKTIKKPLSAAKTGKVAAAPAGKGSKVKEAVKKSP